MKNRDLDNARNPLMLRTKWEEVQMYSHNALLQFPRKERYLLCAQIETAVENTMLEIIRFEHKTYKKDTLQKIDIGLDYLRTLIRESRNYGYISTHTLGVWTGHVDEAGRILGGLVRFYRARAAQRSNRK